MTITCRKVQGQEGKWKGGERPGILRIGGDGEIFEVRRKGGEWLVEFGPGFEISKRRREGGKGLVEMVTNAEIN